MLPRHVPALKTESAGPSILPFPAKCSKRVDARFHQKEKTMAAPTEANPQPPLMQPQPEAADKTRDLHVKGVPELIWRRARCNATNSGMSFKDYLIEILGSCEPIG